MNKTALEKAIFLAGGQSALAEKVTNLGKELSQSAISASLNRYGHRIGDAYVLCVSEVVNFEVTPHELRPDLYPHPEDGLPAHLRCECAKGVQ